MAKKILLVDDSETVLMFEKVMLKELKVEFQTAKNGKEALKAVASFQPDLIILDIMMPEMDGIETCKRLKQDAATQDIPIIMVTTKGEPEKVEAAYTAGCNDFITKPVDKVEFIEKVRGFLNE